MVQQWNSDSETVLWSSGPVMVEECGGTAEEWNSDGGIVWWNSDGGTVWCNSGTVIVEQ